ncbi:MAG TPA: phosphotyrosine protein phosphatase [Allosphingosinicella sp.]|jgi:protein-tyrosine phosphatase
MASRAQAFYLRATAGPGFVRTRYGSARGLARLWLARLGGAGRYRQVEWSRVDRLVFVCTGNICRSPYAERKAAAAGFPAISAALRGSSGAQANESARRIAAAMGVDLSRHRSTAIAEAALRPGDLLVAMEPWQADALASLEVGQVTLLGLWSTPRRPHLHDPHGLCDDYFRTCFRSIDTAVEAMLARLKR